jgi:hypothetical protein
MSFVASRDGKNTQITEIVTFGSPPMMTWYYLSEFRGQRKYIAEQLEIIDFTKV